MPFGSFESARDALRRIDAIDAIETGDVEFPTIDGYTIDRRLGGGGGGDVFAGYSIGTDATVAIKLLRCRLGRDARSEHARRELDLLVQLRPPGIPRVLDYGACDGHLFIVSEFIDGVCIDEWCAERGRSRRDIVGILARAADALHAVHERGLIHRDVKPANILIDVHGDPVLIDLGVATLLARDVHETLTPEGTPIGSPALMPPEQARGERSAVSVRSDVYGLAATAYRVLSGTTPHTTDGGLHDVIRRAAHEQPRAIRSVAPQVPKGLAAVVMKGLETDPARRYASAAEFGADLRHWLAGEPTIARPAHGARRLAHAVRRSPLAAALTLTVVLTTGVMVTLGAQWLRARWTAVTASAHPKRFDGLLLQTNHSYSELGPIAYLGDLDGDQIPEIAVGMPGRPNQLVEGDRIEDAGMVAIVSLDPSNETVDIGSATESGVTLIGGTVAHGGLGSEVACIGDFNADDFPDLAVSAPGRITASDDYQSGIFIVYGGSDLCTSTGWILDRSADEVRTPPALGATWISSDESAFRHDSASRQLVPVLTNPTALGDVSGDGVDDFALCMTDASGRTRLLIVAGDPSRDERTSINLPTDAYAVLEAPPHHDISSVARLDCSAWNQPDRLLLGTPQGVGAPGDDRPGSAWMLDEFPEFSSHSNLAAGAHVTQFRGKHDLEQCGHGICSIGDMNGDGLPDFAISAIEAAKPGNNGGKVYVVFGNAGLLDRPPRIDLSRLDGHNGFTIRAVDRPVGYGDQFGHPVCTAGDFNGDGLADLAIGSHRKNAHGADSGAVYIVLGKGDPYPAEIVRRGGFKDGIALLGGAKDDRFGLFISMIPDLNGDGRDELAVGAPGGAVSGASESGQVYVFFGRSEWDAWLDD